ncbi:hypothetical protein [Limnohabitans sp. G3-2]|nr:hypothetical protein [Limnohabitans sp. G3-2]
MQNLKTLTAAIVCASLLPLSAAFAQKLAMPKKSRRLKKDRSR